jgi:UDP-N-acetyl-D-mannosaminuronic acid dehydrogenase
MAKLVENSFRDVNIAFANELASVCEHLGLDVWEVIALANKHPRVNVLQPGPGVGGHCIAVDPWFIVAAAPEQSRLIRTARETNDARPAEVVAQVGELAEQGASVACLGLAFKPDIDDLRESPAVEVVRSLAEKRPDLQLLAVEPHVSALPRQLEGLEQVRLVETREALAAAQVVVLLVDHKAFKAFTRADLDGLAVVDTRGAWRHLGV